MRLHVIQLFGFQDSLGMHLQYVFCVKYCVSKIYLGSIQLAGQMCSVPETGIHSGSSVHAI